MFWILFGILGWQLTVSVYLTLLSISSLQDAQQDRRVFEITYRKVRRADLAAMAYVQGNLNVAALHVGFAIMFVVLGIALSANLFYAFGALPTAGAICTRVSALVLASMQTIIIRRSRLTRIEIFRVLGVSSPGPSKESL